MITFNRLVLALYSTLWILGCLGLIALAWNTDQMLDIRAGDLSIRAFIDSTESVRIAFTALMLALTLIGAVTFITAIMPQEPAGRWIRVRGDKGAMTRVPATSVENLLKRELESFPEVKRAQARLREQGGLVTTDLDLVVGTGTNIPAVEELATEVTQTILRDRMGLVTAERPRVRASFDTNAVPIARTQPAAAPSFTGDDTYEPSGALPHIQWDTAETRTYSRPRPTWRGEVLLGPEDPPEPKWSPEPTTVPEPIIDGQFREVPDDEPPPTMPTRDTLFVEKEPR